MTDIRTKLKEIESQIELKLAKGEFAEAERLSTEMVVLAENYAQAVESSAVAQTVLPIPVQDFSSPLVHKDEEHLRLLPVFHYLHAGYLAMMSSLLLFYLVMGVLMVAATGSSVEQDVRAVGFVIIGVCISLLVAGLSWAGLNVYTGRCLKERKRHTLCFITEILNCLNFPMGTTLGVCSIIVLHRDRVKMLFSKR